MAAPEVLQKWKYAQQVEKQLQGELKNKDHLPRFGDIDNLIKELRIACEATIFLDFEYATKEGVETHLWAAHSIIKDRYKRLVAHYREKEPKKHVERRKLEQRYADFIKTTQYFYRGYIQRLASHFSGMKGLRRIAHRLSLDSLTVDERVQVSPKIEDLIEKSCHATLLRLGDLSRYRNELRTKDRSWEPALGYYGLAGDLCPDSGSSHNQMAVISLADANYLDALYHLYRAIAVKEPHPLAQGNLELQLKKITTAWEKRKGPNTKGDNEATLVLWFVRLHARFYAGLEFSGHDELENEVLSRLTLLLKEQPFETTLQKIVLINIAAEYFAGERVKQEGSEVRAKNADSFYFFLCLNVRVLSVLLQTLGPELEVQGTGEELPNGKKGPQPERSTEKLAAVARRILPALRQYSIWLVSRALIIIATDRSIGPYIKQMWSIYADVLTKLLRFFPVKELPTLNYLLEEDEITVGFKPFRDPNLAPESNLYTGEDGLLKPRSTDSEVERNHPNIEMKARVRDILVCALCLTRVEKSPIVLNSSTYEFTFVEEGPQLASQIQRDGTDSARTSPRPVGNNFKAPKTSNSTRQTPDVIRAESPAASDYPQGMDTDMHRMVDSLLEPSDGRYSESDETSYGMHSQTANEIFASVGQNGYQLPHRSTQNMLPSLPGIWSSPFTPQPNELPAKSHEHPTSTRQLSPFQLATTRQQFAAAVALDEMTGYSRPKNNSWSTESSRRSSNMRTNTVNQNTVNRVLQESLAQQFMPKSSSMFSESSSIYANTPHDRNISNGGTLSNVMYAASNGNNTTAYAGASDFDRATMLQSSIWNNSQPSWGGYAQTPPRGQGG